MIREVRIFRCKISFVDKLFSIPGNHRYRFLYFFIGLQQKCRRINFFIITNISRQDIEADRLAPGIIAFPFHHYCGRFCAVYCPACFHIILVRQRIVLAFRQCLCTIINCNLRKQFAAGIDLIRYIRCPHTVSFRQPYRIKNQITLYIRSGSQRSVTAIKSSGSIFLVIPSFENVSRSGRRFRQNKSISCFTTLKSNIIRKTAAAVCIKYHTIHGKRRIRHFNQTYGPHFLCRLCSLFRLPFLPGCGSMPDHLHAGTSLSQRCNLSLTVYRSDRFIRGAEGKIRCRCTFRSAHPCQLLSLSFLHFIF